MGRARELAELAASYDSGNIFGMKNRIINGDMRIDQRNAGAAVNVSNATAVYPVDRFFVYEDTSAATLVVQQAGGPDNSTKSFVITNGTGASATAAQVAQIQHRIEGLNVGDLLLGTASASAITLSFWVRSSVTGTYCVSFRNSAQNRSYVAEYTISAANTFERKTVTLTGDTTGTWLVDNGTGLNVTWDLGSGSNFNATAGSWGGANSTRTTNQANWINTSSASFFLGGVQLEKGSAATSFDYRPYGTELMLCQRYYYTTGGSNVYQVFATGQAYSTGQVTGLVVPFPTVMRSSPTFSVSDVTHFLFSDASGNGGVASAVTQTTSESSPQSGNIRGTRNAGGLVAGSASSFFANNTTSARLNWSAEL